MYRSISEKHSLPSTEQSFSSKGGHLVAIQFDLSYLKRSDVKAEATLGYTVLGADQRFGDSALFKASPEDQALYIKWCEKSTELFESGKLKVCPSVLPCAVVLKIDYDLG